MKSRLRTKRGRKTSGYTQRWQVETVMSMIKRNLGEALSGVTRHARNRQMRLLAVVHNIMVVLFIPSFATKQINGDYDRCDDYFTLLRELHADRLAGIVFVSPPYELVDTPLLRMPDLPRVAFTWELLKPLAGVEIIPTDATAWVRGAMERFAAEGRKRVAMLAQPTISSMPSIYAAEAMRVGLETRPYWVQHVHYREPIAACRAVELLFSPEHDVRPDALLLVDDHFVKGATQGLLNAGVRVPEDAGVISIFNYPNPVTSELPFSWFGFDRRESVRQAIGVIDAMRAGRKPEPGKTIPRWLESIA